MRLRHAAFAIACATLPAVVVATPAHAITCPMLLDAVGDAGHFAAPTVLKSDQVDIVSGDVASGATTVVAVLRVTSLNPDTITNLGASWALAWTINGNDYAAQVRRTFGPNATYVNTFIGNGTTTSVPTSIDVVSGTITWTIPRTLLADLATPGATFTLLRAITTLFSSSADQALNASGTYVDQTPGCIPAS